MSGDGRSPLRALAALLNPRGPRCLTTRQHVSHCPTKPTKAYTKCIAKAYMQLPKPVHVDLFQKVC